MKRAMVFIFIVFTTFINLYATPNFIGTWVATINHNGSFDTYEINFLAGNQCIIRISNDRAEQETTGTWFWNGTDLRINATFRNARIAHQNIINWISIVSFIDGNNAFNILGRPAVDAQQVRFTFVRQEVDPNVVRQEINPSTRNIFGDITNILDQSFNTLFPHIPVRSRLAVVNIANANSEEVDYIVNEITIRFVNSRKYTVIERRNVEHILTEQNFQMSGYVDDYSMLSIGKFLGATVVITGSIDSIGSQRWLVFKVLDVLTAEILAMSSLSL